mgnify:CR=1 FL=1
MSQYLLLRLAALSLLLAPATALAEDDTPPWLDDGEDDKEDDRVNPEPLPPPPLGHCRLPTLWRLALSRQPRRLRCASAGAAVGMALGATCARRATKGACSVGVHGFSSIPTMVEMV